MMIIGTKFLYEILSANAAQTLFDVMALFGLIPEEILSLRQFLLLALGTLNGFQRIGVIARIPCLRADGHRGGREILHLFQLEVQPLGQYGKFCHVSL